MINHHIIEFNLLNALLILTPYLTMLFTYRQTFSYGYSFLTLMLSAFSSYTVLYYVNGIPF